MESEAVYGERWHASFAKYDHDLHLWKTHQCSLLEDFIEFSETWPKWGMMQNGVCSERVMSVRRIKETECGSWPTPTAAEADKIPARANYGQVGLNNHPRIRGYPTRLKGEKSRAGGTQIRQTYPTPRCFMHKDALTDRGKSNLGEVINEKEKMTKTGQLNPDWVEWLMGWPISWTSLEPLSLKEFRAWHMASTIASTDSRQSETGK